MRNTLLLSLTTVALLSAGCASLLQKAVQEPKVEYRSVRLTDMDFEGVSLQFDFDVTNPNAIDLNARAYRWNLAIGGQDFLNGVSEAPLAVGARSKSPVSVPLTLTFEQIRQTFGAVTDRDSLPYTFSLAADVDLPVLGVKTFPVGHTGFIPVLRMPQVSFAGIDLNSFSLGGSEVALNVRITNPNFFKLSFSGARYGLKVNGENWMSTAMEQTLELQPKSDVVLSFPIKIDLRQFGVSVYRILTREEAFEYQLVGEGDLGVDLPMFTDKVRLPFDLKGTYSIER